MHCKFLTYKDCDPRSLAAISREFITNIAPAFSVCVHTCHRIEFYSNNILNLAPPPKQLAKDWNSIEGLDNVLKRLAIIACGADSKILGETFIGFQTMRPFLKTPLFDLPFDLIDKAFGASQRIKAIHNFETKFSYDAAAHQLLNQDNPERPNDLVIVGGGLLGQHIAKHIHARRYSKVTIITKHVKLCQEDILFCTNNTIIEVNDIQHYTPPLSFDIIMATNINDTDYKHCLIRLIENRKSGTTIDFCAVPLFKSSSETSFKYITMYDKEFNDVVQSSNSSLADIRPKVVQNINLTIDLLLNK